jgi:hypothetical protein
LLPETAKKPAEFFVNPNWLFCAVPVASLKVRTPIVDPTAALVEMDRLLMLIAMSFSALANTVDSRFLDKCQFRNTQYRTGQGRSFIYS